MPSDNQESRKSAGGTFGEVLGGSAGRVIGEASGIPGAGKACEKIGGSAGRAAGEYMYGADPDTAEVLRKEHFGRRCGR